MADISVTAAQVAPIFPDEAEIYSFIASAAITAGNAVYVIPSSTGAGKVAKADASASGTVATLVGIALNSAGAGQAVDVLKKGHVYGFGVSGMNYFAAAYVSDTDSGVLADAAGTVSKIVGRVLPMSNSDLTKVLYIDLVYA